MPSSWIGTSILTDETEILNDSGVKIHDLLEQNDLGGDEVSIDKEIHPLLWDKYNPDGYTFNLVIGLGVDSTSGIIYSSEVPVTNNTFLQYDGTPSLVTIGVTGGTTENSTNQGVSSGTYSYNLYNDDLLTGGYFAVNKSETTLTIVSDSLLTTQTYTVGLVASRASSGDREADYTLGGVTKTLDAEEQISVGVWEGITKEDLEEGITISTSGWGYVNGIQIQAGVTSLPNMTPPDGTTLRYKIIADAT